MTDSLVTELPDLGATVDDNDLNAVGTVGKYDFGQGGPYVRLDYQGIPMDYRWVLARSLIRREDGSWMLPDLNGAEVKHGDDDCGDPECCGNEQDGYSCEEADEDEFGGEYDGYALDIDEEDEV